MKEKKLSSIAIIVFLFMLTNLFQVKAEEVNRFKVAKTVMEHLCIYLQPDPKNLKEGQLYEIIGKVLATRGISGFLNTDLNQAFSIGEMEEIFNKVYAVAAKDAKIKDASEIKPIFLQPKELTLSLEQLNKIVEYFPKCEPTIEEYTEPTEPVFRPTPPEVTKEDAASEL